MQSAASIAGEPAVPDSNLNPMKVLSIQRHLLSLCLLASIGAAPSMALCSSMAVASAVSSQVEDPKPDKRPEIKETLTQLKKYIGNRKGEQDHDAIGLIDTLINGEFQQSGPRDRKDIVKQLSACLKVKRNTSKEGVRDNKLYLAAAVAMGKMGPESAKELKSWINHKTHRQDLALQRELILSLGKVKEGKSIEFLIDLLTHQRPEVQSAAAEALGYFDDSKNKVRKDIFEEVLKVLGGAKTDVNSDVNDTVARERYDVIEAAMITTLQVMSGQDLRDPEQWQRWWNKNKKDDWDEGA
ncbi:MAG: hypothetical protein ACI841_003842 [Planctomycetota bacterium]